MLLAQLISMLFFAKGQGLPLQSLNFFTFFNYGFSVLTLALALLSSLLELTLSKPELALLLALLLNDEEQPIYIFN